VLRHLLILPLLALVSLTLSCERTWNAANRSSLRTDVAAVLESHGIDRKGIVSCRMVETTRAGVCSLTLTPDEVTRLVDGLELAAVDLTSQEGQQLLSRVTTDAGAADELHDKPSKKQQVWGLFDRPRQLNLRQGAAFEYLVLSYWKSDAWARLYVSYTYG
jgi:hypothetical protein